ncbi:MAG: hypothetical protein ACXVBX_13090 [Flavisolibacter sp.]
MKRIILFICMLFVTGCAMGELLSMNMKNAPTNFRGVDFGTNVNKSSDMIVEYQDGLITRCTRKDDKMYMMGAKVDKILYNFYKGDFYEARILFKSIDNFYSIRDALYSQHGLSLESKSTGLGIMRQQMTGRAQSVPEQTKERHSWYSKTTYITLEYTGGECILRYQFTPILKNM